MIAALFWLAVGLLAYTYLGFPLLVCGRGVLVPRRFRADDITPAVSVIIAAHNESAGIGAKVENLLELDYPEDVLEIVIASDGSDDGTDAIVASYEERDGRAVRLLSLPRRGRQRRSTPQWSAHTARSLSSPTRTRCTHRMPCGESSAPSPIPPWAVWPATNAISTDRSVDGIAQGEDSYWSFDRLLKKAESTSGSVISATGAIYAIRRPLFAPVRADVTDDFYTSTGVIVQGRRLVFAPDAVAYEPTAASGADEFGRKVRVMTRGLRGVIARRALLNPFQHGFYAVQLFSHKVLRRLMLVPLALLLVTSGLRWEDGRPYQVLTIVQIVLYGLGIVGLLVQRTSLGKLRLFSVPAFFCLVNAAAACAVWNVIRGHRIDRWEPRRIEEPSGPDDAPRGDPSSPEGTGEDLAWRPKS